MTCPTEARLRAHVDVPDAAVDAHVSTCAPCADQLAAVGGNARFAARAVAGLYRDVDGAVDVDAALTRVAPSEGPRRGRARASLAVAAGLVALLVAALVTVTPTGRQAAAALLASFRAERLQVVTVDPDEPLSGLEGLDDIVEVDADDPQQSERVDTLEAAADVVGFAPATPTALPDGARLAEIQASAPGTARLTFDAGRAPDLPQALDGAQLVVSVPGAVASHYRVGDSSLVVAEAGQLSVDAAGADLAQIREYLLSRPEVPADLARQLLAIDDWTTTLPIPVPVDRLVWRDTTVAGHPGLMLEDTVGAGLLWQADDRIRAVGAEGLDVETLRQVADGLG